jgi:hypothetical protein
MAGEGVRMTCRIVGDRGEATAALKEIRQFR